jgi:hypothetical protein
VHSCGVLFVLVASSARSSQLLVSIFVSNQIVCASAPNRHKTPIDRCFVWPGFQGLAH